MTSASEWRLERYWSLLRMQVRQLELDPRWQRRFDASDLVQETLLRAHQHLADFRGQSEAELVKWLQGILGHAVVDEVRKAQAQKRDLALERSLEAAVADSSARLEAYLQADQSTPSQHAERSEQLLRQAAALDQLPEDQRNVIVLRHLQGASVGQIAQQLGKTEKSVAGLLFRGMQKLRELLAETE